MAERSASLRLRTASLTKEAKLVRRTNSGQQSMGSNTDILVEHLPMTSQIGNGHTALAPDEITSFRESIQGYVNEAFEGPEPLRDRTVSDATESSFMFTKTEDFRNVIGQMEVGAGTHGAPNLRINSTLVDIDLAGREPVDGGNIMVTRTARLEPVDFSSEITPRLDADGYMAHLTVLLDVQRTSLTQVVDQLVREMTFKKEPDTVFHEVNAVIYSDENRTTFAQTIQGVVASSPDSLEGQGFDCSWAVAICSVPSIKERRVGIARLVFPANFGPRLEAVRFLVVVISPAEIKATMSAIETGRTIATLLGDLETRYRLTSAQNRNSVITALRVRVAQLAKIGSNKDRDPPPTEPSWSLGLGLWENLTRRAKYYPSDFVDAFRDVRSIQKVLSTTLFIYFSIIFPTIAFGALNGKNTDGKSDANRALLGQALGGLIWAVFAGQPLVVIATTALVSLYSKVVFEIAVELGADFYTVYAWVGLWNTLFVLIYSVFGLSNLIKFSTRCVEEIFAGFIVVCFFFNAILDTVMNFKNNFMDTEACKPPPPPRPEHLDDNGTTLVLDITTVATAVTTSFNGTYDEVVVRCNQDVSILALILLLGTLWLALTVFEFKDSPYLTQTVREVMSEYALPVGVVVFSFIGSFCFRRVPSEVFTVNESIEFTAASLATTPAVIGVTAGLGFALSLLFFMDQNITGQIVNSPLNNLKKGEAKHLDMLWIAIINCFLSIYGLPWMHGVLPQSPLHVVCLADTEEIVQNGHVRQVITKVRETRVTGIVSHILIGITLYFIPWILTLVPIPVLDGLFVYCAVSALRGNSFWERIKLMFTEQNRYPPTHYVRKCPQKSMHLFTLSQIVQLVILCFIGFAPSAYVQMTFPLFIAFLIPIRHLIIPLFIEKKHLAALDAFE